MVTQYNIEEKATDYMVTTGKKPRFVLLDSASFRALNQMFTPKERIDLFVEQALEYAPEPRLLSIHLSKDIDLEILEVNTTRHLFEVVG